MPYVALQQLIDEPNAWGSYGYDKGAYLADLTDDVIDVLTTYVARKASPLSLLIFYWLDGAYAEVHDQATAFSGPRTPCYFGNLIALCPTQEMLPAERQWIRDLSDDLRPYALGSTTYVNVTPEPMTSLRCRTSTVPSSPACRPSRPPTIRTTSSTATPTSRPQSRPLRTRPPGSDIHAHA